MLDSKLMLRQEFSLAPRVPNMARALSMTERDRYSEIDKLYKAYQAEQILLTDDLRKKRENEIINREKEAKDLQKQRFGVDGDLFKKRMELVKPIQDKVYNAIKTVAEKAGIAIIFDKASDMMMLYANPKYDKSDDILAFLGYTKKTGK